MCAASPRRADAASFTNSNIGLLLSVEAKRMKYGKLWKTMFVIILLGALLIGGGLFNGGITRIVLIGVGSIFIIAALTRRATVSLVIGLLAGGAIGYFFDVTDSKFLGIIIVCASVGVAGWIMGAILGLWSRKIKNKTEKSLAVLQKDTARTRKKALDKIEMVENTIKRTGPYHRDAGHYHKEIKYVHDKVDNIRYGEENTRSMENANFQYSEMINYMDRIMEKIDPYSATTAWTLEESRYGGYTPITEYRPKKKKEKEKEKKKEKEEVPKEVIQIKPSKDYVRSLRPPKGESVKPRIARALPNYNINKKINSNDFAETFSGKSHDGRDVVIKVPRIEKGNNWNLSVVAEFLSRTDQWDDLDDEHVVKIYDREVRPAFHVVMERMDGGDLKALMETHELNVEEVVNIMVQILRGISSAHEKGVVHGDLKPSNILFRDDGKLKISDWGWEKFQNATNPRKFLSEKCKQGYCTPEHLEPNEFGKVDEATDQFQLGILFYEMLTGVRPFHAEGKDQIAKNVIEKEIEPPSVTNPDVPELLDKLILKALEKKKEARWGSTKLMYDEMNKLVAD